MTLGALSVWRVRPIAASILLGVAFFVVPQVVAAATLTFTPPSGNFNTGDTISVTVSVDPGGASVNAADGTISFDSKLLSVSGVSKSTGFSLWTSDPTFDNSAGTVSFSGGTPTPFSSAKPILTITFTANAPGTAAVSVSKGSILAADGKGTDVFKAGTDASFTIAAGSSDSSGDSTDNSGDSSASDAASSDAPPPATIISSPTNPQSDNWYATTSAQFSWTLTSDITGVRTLLSTSATDTPKTKLKTATTSQTVGDIKDGVWYFLVQLENDGGWGDVANYKVQVDTTPPNQFDVSLQPAGSDGTPAKLLFKTDDALSGVDHYEVIFGSSTVGTVQAADVTDSGYAIPPQAGGPTLVTIKAFDKAGNMTSASKTLTLPAVAAPAAADATAAPAASGSSLWTNILLLLFAIGIGALISLNFYSRK